MRPPMDARIARRRREVRSAAVRRRRRVAVTLVVLALLCGGGVFVTTSPLFAVSSVLVDGATGEQAAAIRAAADIAEGDNILRLDTDAVAARVRTLPWIRSVEVGRIPPATIELHVEVREPAVMVELRRGTWLLDMDGVVLAGGHRDGLARVVAPGSVVPGVGDRVADAAVRNAIAVHRELPGPLRAAVLEYDARSESDLRFLLDAPGVSDGGIWVRFGFAERIDAKARVIGLLLEQAREQAATEAALPAIAEFDVRAPDNPVLVPAT